jgi:hypothetical protein
MSTTLESMVIDMNDKQLATLAQLQAFLEGTTVVDFTVAADERDAFIARTVRRFGYRLLPRARKAVVLRYLERVSGYSRQQINRLVKWSGGRRPLIKRYRASRTSFARTYTSADVRLLAHTDTGRNKVAHKPWILLQPRLHVRLFVRAVVVHHQVQLLRRREEGSALVPHHPRQPQHRFRHEGDDREDDDGGADERRGLANDRHQRLLGHVRHDEQQQAERRGQ